MALSAARQHPMSYSESPESKSARTVNAERCVNGFPVGFGGWSAARMYERNVNDSKPVTHNQTDSSAATAARQEVSPILYSNTNTFVLYRMLCNFVYSLNACYLITIRPTGISTRRQSIFRVRGGRGIDSQDREGLCGGCALPSVGVKKILLEILHTHLYILVLLAFF